MNTQGNILAIDDDRISLKLIESNLKDTPFRVTAVDDPEKALGMLSGGNFDLVLSDIRMPGLDGFRILEEISLNHPDLPLILITAHGSISDAVRAIRQGAFDYLTKPLDREELVLKIRRAIETRRLRRENRDLRNELAGQYGLENIVGRSKPMREVFRQVAKVAPTDVSVLIAGESGTGKELLARAIHQNSSRKDRPFIPVDCGSIPRTLLESELFGHARGAFTGAYRDHPGAFEVVKDGTLFFDEIGDMEITLQSALLRALQERVFKRVGENRLRSLEARLIFGTHIDLAEAVRNGTFREDLLYRISVVPITLPALRDRPSDIPLLVRHFLEGSCRRHEVKMKRIDPGVIDALTRAPWKGNVRELENFIENLTVMSDGDRITVRDLPRSPEPGEEGGGAPAVEGIGPRLKDIEREHILRVLAGEGGNRSRTAKKLGISLRGLRYKLKAYAEEGLM